MSQTSGFAGRKPRKDEEFHEEDVWDVDHERHEDSSPRTWRSHGSSGSSSFAWRHNTAPRAIPRANAATSHETSLVKRSSAAQDIPDWSKIYGKKNTKGSWYADGVGFSTNDVEGCHYRGNSTNGDDDHADDDDDDVVPPHEWIARKLARSQISSFSVCEGVGRTLKGRDLSKVRDAILTKTGFIE